MTVESDAAPQARGARYVGQPIQRVEDPRLLAGRGRYIDDITRTGLLSEPAPAGDNVVSIAGR